MELKKADQPAFPYEYFKKVSPHAEGKFAHAGLTKREYFAAMAMQGLIQKWGTAFGDGSVPKAIAMDAIQMADALLAELEK